MLCFTAIFFNFASLALDVPGAFDRDRTTRMGNDVSKRILPPLFSVHHLDIQLSVNYLDYEFLNSSNYGKSQAAKKMM